MASALRVSRTLPRLPTRTLVRLYASQPPEAPTKDKGPKTLVHPPSPPVEYNRQRSQISSLSKNPWVVRAVKAIAPFMGYYSKTTTAIRETRPMYAKCGERLERETDFLYKECALPPTYQTWFQFTLLHVLILTARLRALPPDASRTYQAELINHFFLDIEHRMRTVLGPKAPERIVKGYLNEMRDQWRGGGVAFDLGIIDTDATLAGMIWRNLFASRGAPPPQQDGKEKKVLANAQDIELPSTLYKFVVYVRRELKRLEGISDEDIKLGHIGEWGTVSSIPAPEGAADYEAWQTTGQTIRSGGKQAAASG
ncbi:unnamed protein product [Rhizoctonia solani]|uniref:Ubiquinol-cytochrome c chaperone domain-containing protein n=1 Tax=Rhizoctonia solani TaxID=456999 RepID=A0A8H3AQ66_9AGAM|nr:unnamed protein product [Rhizoctonia solani]